MLKIAVRLTVAVLTCMVLLPPAPAQNQASMERMLNAIDRPAVWNNVPVSGTHTQAAPSGMARGSLLRPSTNQQPIYGRQQGVNNQQGFGGNSGFAQQQRFPANGFGGGGMPNQMGGGMMNRIGGGMANQMRPAASPFAQPAGGNIFSRENILKTLFGGEPSGGTNSAQNDPSKQANAQENLSTALDRAQKAENDCERASNGNDKSSRMSAAESARYAASAARAAADRATSSAYGGSSEANGYAAQARDAADRAQAAADRATANAENFSGGNGGGW